MTDEDWKQKFAAFAPLVLASGQVMGSERLPVCYAFRLAPNNEYDSGWNFWSGQESQEYVNDADHFGICPLKIFLEMDPSLNQIIDAPVGSAWERESNSPWRRVQSNAEDDR